MVNFINWFEIPCINFEDNHRFYSVIFDIDDKSASIQTSGDFKMFIFPASGVTGALVKGEGYKPSKDGCRVYLNGGNDLKGVLEKVVPNGGKIIVDKTKIPDANGYYAIFEDLDGNHVGLYSEN